MDQFGLSNLLHGVPWSLLYFIRLRWGRCGGLYAYKHIDIWEYKTSISGDAEFTASGVLFGHLYMGALLIKGFTADGNYNKEKVQLLIHMILSHHGTQEWGAVSCPAIPEAFALHYIDNLDAKMYMCEEHYEELEPGEIREKKPFGLDNRIYKPNYDK